MCIRDRHSSSLFASSTPIYLFFRLICGVPQMVVISFRRIDRGLHFWYSSILWHTNTFECFGIKYCRNIFVCKLSGLLYLCMLCLVCVCGSCIHSLFTLSNHSPHLGASFLPKFTALGRGSLNRAWCRFSLGDFHDLFPFGKLWGMIVEHFSLGALKLLPFPFSWGCLPHLPFPIPSLSLIHISEPTRPY